MRPHFPVNLILFSQFAVEGELGGGGYKTVGKATGSHQGEPYLLRIHFRGAVYDVHLYLQSTVTTLRHVDEHLTSTLKMSDSTSVRTANRKTN